MQKRPESAWDLHGTRSARRTAAVEDELARHLCGPTGACTKVKKL